MEKRIQWGYGGDMKLKLNDELDLQKISDSGQSFRWQPLSETAGAGKEQREQESSQKTAPGRTGYRIIAYGKVIELWQSQDKTELELNGSGKEDEKFWKNYLDLDSCYRELRQTIDPEDHYLAEAAQYGAGIRILRQEFFETLITFIISQRKNIPAIRSCVERLCRIAGSAIDAERGFYAFPNPEQILALQCHKRMEKGCSYQEQGIGSCGLGYRMPYLFEAAEWMLKNPDFPEEQKTMTDQEVLDRLCEIRGVGVKVGSCTMLFGLHRMNLFPVDVWIGRVLERAYPRGFDLARYAPYAGLMQQYLFYAIRGEQKRVKGTV